MTPKRRPERPRPGRVPPHPGGPRPSDGGPGRMIVRAVIVVAALVVAVSVWYARRHPVPPAHPDAALPTEAVIDSQRAAFASKNWAKSVEWAEVLASRSPRDPMRLLGAGLAWHNLAWGGSPYARARAATRTSLERIAMEHRALALLDSAAAVARTTADWARIRHWRAQLHENLGLPVDALQGYDEVLRRAPEFPSTGPRARWILERMRDPVGGGEAPGDG